MEIVDTDPDDHLTSLDDDARAVMSAVDRVLTAAMPTRRRVLWEGVFWGGTEQSVIGYGDIRQPRPKGKEVEWFLIGLARQKTTYSLYVNAVKDGAYLGQAYGDRVAADGGKVKLGSASIGFRRLDDLDLDVLAELAAEADRLTPPDP